MAEQKSDNYVELDGVKYQEDPENKGELLLGDDNKPVLYQGSSNTQEKKTTETGENEEIDVNSLVRKSVIKDRIIQRKNELINKLRSKVKKETQDDEEEEIVPEEKEFINNSLEEKLGEKLSPLTEMIKSQSDEAELRDVLSHYPDAKSLEKNIRKFMEHPQFQGVSVETIYFTIKGRQAAISEAKNKADEEAENESINSGHPFAPALKKSGKIPDVSRMSDKEIETLAHNVKTGQFSS